ncbi:DUF4893 domain-containing protein [Paracoccus acridae]|uniref:DUF4893 domain-containing protein n=1 Tax=Paracoccus acridae TaxID=1795310 RepID=A0ABQ1VH50_9RHOB|nr:MULTISPECIES: DUF4893 domain-containing protein [Paracoccus]GGF65154.1 DUF4893 domain-containing protein [Paracoccus acridae]
MRRVELLALAALLLPLPVLAQPLPDGPVPRSDDQRRLSEYHAAAGEALLGAFAVGDPADLALLTAGLAGEALSPERAIQDMAGDWSCRMIKLGGLLPITVYSPFRCTISPDGGFEKLTGSQRTKGNIHQDGDRLIYLGTGFVAGDMPPSYENLPAQVDPQASPQFMPEIGVVEMVSDRKGRVLFPAPYLESRFNILLLSR